MFATQSGTSTQSEPYLWAGFFVLTFTVAVNIPFWIACHFLNLLPIGWFSIEALLGGLVVLFVSRWLGGLLLLFFFAENLLVAVSKTYYLTPLDALSHAGSMTAFSLHRVVVHIAVGLFAILFFACLAVFPITYVPKGGPRIAAAAGIMLFALVGLGVDNWSIHRSMGRFANPIWGPHTGDENRFTHYRSLWFFRYATLRLRTTQMLFARTPVLRDAPHLLEFPQMESARQAALSQVDLAGERPNVVLIVVESWGLFNDGRSQNLLEGTYSKSGLGNKYQIETGSVPFAGSTVNGEVRELCNSSFGFEVERAAAQELSTCLPTQLKALGYQATAVHGMDGHLFARNEWYSNIGFEDIWFRKRFLAAGLQQCVGAFRGICDSSIASWITGRLQMSEQPQFLYWMTLNSHLPLPVPSGLPDAASCGALPAGTVTGPFCSWYQFMANVHRSIAQIAQKTTRPTVFVIVGDHAPPFSNAAVRDLFSQSKVPYVLLLPKFASNGK